MPGTTIRPATGQDGPVLATLVAALAAFEGKASPTPDARTLAGWLEAEPPPFEVLLAESGGEAVGYLAFYRAFSLFKPGPVLLVENLYVDEAARGTGVGRALLAEAAAEALRRGWRRLELNVRADNPSLAAYRALGFEAPGESVQRLEDAALTALAERAYLG